MLDRLEKLFKNRPQIDDLKSTKNHEQKIKLATAAVFIDMAYADFKIDANEEQEITASLQSLFELDTNEITQLIREAKVERDSKLDIYNFTKLLNQHFERGDRVQILEKLWLLIYADGRVDKYEDALIRKMTTLLGLEHGDMIKAKLKMKPEGY